MVITETATIYAESDTDGEDTQAALSDIQVGDIIAYEQNDAGEVTSVTIMNAFSVSDMQGGADGQGQFAPGTDSQGSDGQGMSMPGSSSSGA